MMAKRSPSRRANDEAEISRRAHELIARFSINGGREDLLALAIACEQFDDELGRAAGREIRRRALLLET